MNIFYDHKALIVCSLLVGLFGIILSINLLVSEKENTLKDEFPLVESRACALLRSSFVAAASIWIIFSSFVRLAGLAEDDVDDWCYLTMLLSFAVMIVFLVPIFKFKIFEFSISVSHIYIFLWVIFWVVTDFINFLDNL